VSIQKPNHRGLRRILTKVASAPIVGSSRCGDLAQLDEPTMGLDAGTAVFWTNRPQALIPLPRSTLCGSFDGLRMLGKQFFARFTSRLRFYSNSLMTSYCCKVEVELYTTENWDRTRRISSSISSRTVLRSVHLMQILPKYVLHLVRLRLN
jgi:hypothetical protein